MKKCASLDLQRLGNEKLLYRRQNLFSGKMQKPSHCRAILATCCGGGSVLCWSMLPIQLTEIRGQ